MQTQYLAARLSCGQVTEASESQGESLGRIAYLFETISDTLGADCTQAINTSRAGLGGYQKPSETVDCYRSKERCQRASNCLPCSQWLPVWQHAAVAPKKKNTLWSIQSPSALNRFTPASTNKYNLGRALRSVPVSPAPERQEVLAC